MQKLQKGAKLQKVRNSQMQVVDAKECVESSFCDM